MIDNAIYNMILPRALATTLLAYTVAFGLLATSPVFYGRDGALRRYGGRFGSDETPLPLWLGALMLTVALART